MTFNHHHAEVLALAVSRDGETMCVKALSPELFCNTLSRCSGSRDRSIRVYVLPFPKFIFVTLSQLRPR